VTAFLAAVGVAAGAALQSATGFGFALIAAPLLFAAVGPAEAVGALIVVSMFTSTLTLATEGRRPEPVRREVVLLLGWAVPGALVGVVILRALSAQALQLVLTAGVLLTLILRHRTRHAPSRPAPVWAGPLAGFASGALTTSTSTSGPPLVTYLLGRGHEPGPVRDTLTVCFLGLNPIGALALLVTGTTDASPELLLVAILVPATALGQIAGRPVFRRLAGGGNYEPVLTVVLLISVAVGLVAAFTS
jgi:uncharacterized membrane protein YfcA